MATTKTGIQIAIAKLSNSKSGVTPTAVQNASGLTRLFSRWDMKNLANRTGRKLVTVIGRDGHPRYRLEAKAPRASAAASKLPVAKVTASKSPARKAKKA